MNRVPLLLIALALTSTAFAGCLGDDDIDTSIPRAVVTVTPVEGQADTFQFDASRSTGKGLKYEWSFGDGATGTEPKETHTYTYGSGEYTAILVITDLNGVPDRWTDTVTVGSGQNLPPTAAFTPSARVLLIGEPLTVDASATTDPDGDPIIYEWDFNSVMTKDQYVEFKDRKLHQDELPAEDGTDVSDGSDSSDKMGPSLPDARDVLDDPDRLMQKSPGSHGPGGHGGDEWDISLFDGRRTADGAVYTLENGFPDVAVYVVLLTAYDIKGATRQVLSQDAWAVEVVETKKKEVYTESQTGTFNAGGQSTFTEQTPDDDTYSDEKVITVPIPDPIAIMYVNVTWTQNPVYDSADQVPNDIDVLIVSPNDSERKDYGVDDQGQHEERFLVNGTSDFGTGDWTIHLWARQGANIGWTVEVWAKVDLNPFREIEAEHH